MVRLTVCLGLVFPFCVPTACFAQDKEERVRLVWKGFDERVSKPYFQEIRTKTDQVITTAGVETKQTQDQTFVIRWTPHQPDRDQNWRVTQEIVRVKVDIDAGGAKIAHDTDLAGDAGPLGEFFNALVNARLRFTIDRSMKLKDVTGHEALLKKLGDANPATKPLLESILSRDAMVQMVEPTIAPFPVEPVKIGSRWERSSELKIGGLGTYITHYTYTYEGKSDGLDKIGIASTIRFAPPREADGKLPFKIKKGNLRGRNGKGFALFDRDTGRFVRGELAVEIQGDLVIEIGGAETTVVLQQMQMTTFRTSPERPK